MARCPQCKEPVSQFAAGCSTCGADLDAARREQAARRRRLALPRLPSVPDDLVVVVIMALLTLCAPLLGTLLSGFVALRERATGQRALRIALWTLVAVGVVLLAAPRTRYAGLLALTG